MFHNVPTPLRTLAVGGRIPVWLVSFNKKVTDQRKNMLLFVSREEVESKLVKL